MWSSKFFELKPVGMERIDVLEARLADVEEEGCRFCRGARPAKAGEEESRRIPTHTEFETLRQVKIIGRRSRLQWKELASEHFAASWNGDIRAPVTGGVPSDLRASMREREWHLALGGVRAARSFSSTGGLKWRRTGASSCRGRSV